MRFSLVYGLQDTKHNLTSEEVRAWLRSGEEPFVRTSKEQKAIIAHVIKNGYYAEDSLCIQKEDCP